MEEEIRLAFTGDVMLGRLVNNVLGLDRYSYVWGNRLPMLKSADLRLINLECVIAERGEPLFQPPKPFYFKADPDAIKVLKNARVNYVSLASNHSLDFGEEALYEMMSLLDRNGIAHTGAGINLAEASKPALWRLKVSRWASSPSPTTNPCGRLAKTSQR